VADYARHHDREERRALIRNAVLHVPAEALPELWRADRLPDAGLRDDEIPTEVRRTWSGTTWPPSRPDPATDEVTRTSGDVAGADRGGEDTMNATIRQLEELASEDATELARAAAQRRLEDSHVVLAACTLDLHTSGIISQIALRRRRRRGPGWDATGQVDGRGSR
jgi:hypothetical protein